MAARKTDGERVASLAASFEAEKNYQHERWHKLDNDLTPIVNLPRDLAKMEGRLRGEMSTYATGFERAVSKAIEKALSPINEELGKIRGDVDDLKGWRREQTSERGLLKMLLQSPILMYLVMLAGIVWAAVTGRLK